jgi:O-antigen/teichoic acid export membrane protein
MKLVDKGIINVIAKSSEAFLLLASSMIMVRYLTKAEYGTFLQFMLIVNTVIILSLMGLPSSIYYFYERTSERYHLIKQSFWVSVGLGLFCGLIIYGLMSQISMWFNNPVLEEYSIIPLLLIFFHTPVTLREAMLIANGNLILNSIVTLISNLFVYGVLIICVCNSFNIFEILLGMVVTRFINFFVFIIIIKSIKSKNSHSVDKRKAGRISFKEQIYYSFPIGLSSYLGIIGKQIDQYIISVFFLPSDYVIYSRGAMRIPVLHSIQLTINNILMPKYMRSYLDGDIKTFLTYYHRSIEMVALIKFPVFAFLLAVAPTIITILYTIEYIGASSILRIYLILLVTGIAVYGIIPRITAHTSLLLHQTAIFVSTNIILSLILVYMWGPLGAAIATIFSTIVGLVYVIIRSCRLINISIRDIFPWNYLGRLFLVSILASLPIYILNNIYQTLNIPLFVIFFIDMVIYAYLFLVMITRLDLLNNDVLDILQRWFRFDVNRWLRRLAFL